jgi:ABC-2 type transport system ATP-binding protein
VAAGQVWLAPERDDRAELSWRAGDGRWRHIGARPPAGAEIVAPTTEDGYLVLSGAAGRTGGDR